tara:strand:+ start:1706 stop:2263 length:558 start_codon:yes stop_codon:yes gene_type:complete
MRIIAGKFKGKKIFFSKSKITRPLKDSVRENIFNILKHSSKINVNIENSNILDLYSGIGSFGLECISRGAKKVTFVEKDSATIEILKKNIKILSIDHNTRLINSEVEKIFKLIEKNKYNIFFLDPPFKDNIFAENIKIINKKNLCEKNHLFIIHRERKSKDNLNDLNILISKTYGRSKLIFGTLI